MSQSPATQAGEKDRDSSEIVAEHMARTGFADLPDDVVAAAKASILDTIACIYAGTASEDVQRTRDLMRDWGGNPSSIVIGGGGVKVPPDAAVLANGAAVHQDDFDDCSDYAPSHPTSASFVPALAVGEEIGGRSGKDLIVAVALGNDLVCRLSKSIVGRIFDHPWFRAPVCGLFGATAAAAKMMGASADQHRHALGLALPLVGGTWASLHHADSSVRSVRDGLSYRNGVLAAELAMRGLRGDPEVFDGKYGFFQAFFNGDYRRGDVVDDLGSFYETARVSLKPWPSMRNLHQMVTAVLDAMERHDLVFEQIEQVDMEVGQINLTRCGPVTVGSIPDKRIDLLCNLPFAVGAAIRHRNVPLALFHSPEMADDIVLNALPKVKWHYSERQDTESSFEVGRVTITTVEGKSYEGEAPVALGNPHNPMSLERRRGKFDECLAQSRVRVPADRAGRIVETVENLEDVTDLRNLAELLA